VRARLSLLVLSSTFCLTSFLHSQAPAAKHAPLVTPKPSEIAAPKPAAPTELERTKLENIQLRMALLQQEEMSLPQRRQELQVQYGEIIQAIERENPGYVWNPQTGSLVPKPIPAPAPKPEKKPEGAK
jgi:hypothetical protein